MQLRLQPAGQQPSMRKKRWTRRKRIAMVMVFLMVLAPFLAAGAYVWQIGQAIEDVQDHAVVELPTRSAELGGIRNMTPNQDVAVTDPEDSATPQSTDGTSNEAPQTTEPTAPDEQPAETAAPTAAPTRTASSPGSFTILKDLVGTGTGADRVDPQSVWKNRDHINILVLGVDTREDESDQNADVIMIARVDFNDYSVRSVSIPRDLEVEVPGHGRSKINGAYNIGRQENPRNPVSGVAMMRDTIEYNFGIPIDEYVLIDFDGFEAVIDAVGGITVDVPERIVDEAYPTEDYGTRTLIIEAGKQNMDGETALAYSRTRHQDSDDHRRERQMLVLRALLDKGQSLGSVTRITQLIRATGDAVTTSIGWDEQLALVSIALRLDQENVVFANIKEPLVQPGTSENGAWIYVGDPVEIGSYIEDVLSGKEPVDATPQSN